MEALGRPKLHGRVSTLGRDISMGSFGAALTGRAYSSMLDAVGTAAQPSCVHEPAGSSSLDASGALDAANAPQRALLTDHRSSSRNSAGVTASGGPQTTGHSRAVSFASRRMTPLSESQLSQHEMLSSDLLQAPAAHPSPGRLALDPQALQHRLSRQTTTQSAASAGKVPLQSSRSLSPSKHSDGRPHGGATPGVFGRVGRFVTAVIRRVASRNGTQEQRQAEQRELQQQDSEPLDISVRGAAGVVSSSRGPSVVMTSRGPSTLGKMLYGMLPIGVASSPQHDSALSLDPGLADVSVRGGLTRRRSAMGALASVQTLHPDDEVRWLCGAYSLTHWASARRRLSGVR